VKSPLANGKDIDWVVIRENSEASTAAAAGARTRAAHRDGDGGLALHPRRRRAHPPLRFQLAARRAAQAPHLVTKSNAQRFGMVMWDEIFYEVAKEFPDVKHDRELVDAMTTRMVLKPATIDVMVATNLHADILSDLAAALSGSLGIAPTANLNPERDFPSMFEPIHGSAFDITGKGVAIRSRPSGRRR
jgi:tartrate dehydrogenase/decarboxylase/D-malate dehydrogenase